MNTSGVLIPYLRKSKKEDETQSFARQRAAIQGWAEAHHVPLADEVHDAGVSGGKHWKDRGLGQAVAAVQNGEASGIIVEELSRLTRGSQLHAAELWDALDKADARLVITADGIDTASGDHELSFGLRALIARQQHKEYSRRMADFKMRKTAEGIAFGPMPLGYRKDAEGRAEVDPATAPIIRELFEQRLSGQSYTNLANLLRERTGRKWTRQAVTFILANELYYTGHVRYGDDVSEHDAGAIIDQTLWQAVQRTPSAPTRGTKAKWLLTGIVYCAVCFSRLEPVTTPGGMKDRKYHYYRCLDKECPHKPRPGARREQLDEFVMETLWTFIGDRVRQPHSAPDLKPLAEKVERARLLWDQAKTPEMQAAYGADAAQVITERRRDYEEALVALGEAEAAASPAELIDLREQWASLDDQQKREQLRRYPVERVMVGPKITKQQIEEWEKENEQRAKDGRPKLAKPEPWRVVFA